MKYIVYCTRNNKNSKIYIGVHKTENPTQFDGYLGCGIYSYNKKFKADTAFKAAVKKYGSDNFIRTTISIKNTEEEAYALEQVLVDKNFVKRRDTYNMTVGGKNTSGNLTKIRVAQYDLNGNFLQEFESCTEASREVDVFPSDISNAINGKQLSCKGYIWRKAKKHNPDKIKVKYGKTIKVVQYSKSGYRMKTWESVTAAALHFNCDKSSISAICKGKKGRKTLSGFQWRYESDRMGSLPPIRVKS